MAPRTRRLQLRPIEPRPQAPARGERSTLRIGPGGKLAREWRGVKVAGHAEELLAAVRNL